MLRFCCFLLARSAAPNYSATSTAVLAAAVRLRLARAPAAPAAPTARVLGPASARQLAQQTCSSVRDLSRSPSVGRTGRPGTDFFR